MQWQCKLRTGYFSSLEFVSLNPLAVLVVLSRALEDDGVGGEALDSAVTAARNLETVAELGSELSMEALHLDDEADAEFTVANPTRDTGEEFSTGSNRLESSSLSRRSSDRPIWLD